MAWCRTGVRYYPNQCWLPHVDLIKWKQFPRYWPFVRGIHRPPLPSQSPVSRSFDVFFDLHLNKQFNIQTSRRWLEKPSRSLWCHRNELIIEVLEAILNSGHFLQPAVCSLLQCMQKHTHNPRLCLFHKWSSNYKLKYGFSAIPHDVKYHYAYGIHKWSLLLQNYGIFNTVWVFWNVLWKHSHFPHYWLLCDESTRHRSIQSFYSHCTDVIMSAMASQFTSVSIVCSTVRSGADQRRQQSSTLLTFVRGIHRLPVNSPHKGPVTRKLLRFGDIIPTIVGQGISIINLTTVSNLSR